MSIPVCSCLFLSIHVYSCIFPFIPVDSCIFPSILVFFRLYLPILFILDIPSNSLHFQRPSIIVSTTSRTLFYSLVFPVLFVSQQFFSIPVYFCLFLSALVFSCLFLWLLVVHTSHQYTTVCKTVHWGISVNIWNNPASIVEESNQTCIHSRYNYRIFTVMFYVCAISLYTPINNFKK